MPGSTDVVPDCFTECAHTHQLSLTSHQKGKCLAPLEKCVSRLKDFLFPMLGGTWCVLLAETINWSSPYRRTTVYSSGLFWTVKDGIWPSTSRSSPCVDTPHQSTASDTTTPTPFWLLLVPKGSSNCGVPSLNEVDQRAANIQFIVSDAVWSLQHIIVLITLTSSLSLVSFLVFGLPYLNDTKKYKLQQLNDFLRHVKNQSSSNNGWHLKSFTLKDFLLVKTMEMCKFGSFSYHLGTQ